MTRDISRELDEFTADAVADAPEAQPDEAVLRALASASPALVWDVHLKGLLYESIRASIEDMPMFFDQCLVMESIECDIQYSGEFDNFLMQSSAYFDRMFDLYSPMGELQSWGPADTDMILNLVHAGVIAPIVRVVPPAASGESFTESLWLTITPSPRSGQWSSVIQLFQSAIVPSPFTLSASRTALDRSGRMNKSRRREIWGDYESFNLMWSSAGPEAYIECNRFKDPYYVSKSAERSFRGKPSTMIIQLSWRLSDAEAGALGALQFLDPTQSLMLTSDSKEDVNHQSVYYLSEMAHSDVLLDRLDDQWSVSPYDAVSNLIDSIRSATGEVRCRLYPLDVDSLMSGLDEFKNYVLGSFDYD